MCMWCTLWFMKLATYLSERSISDAAFAAKIGVDRSSVTRMRAKGQVPSPATIRVIAEQTDGLVTPNDFFDVQPRERAA